MAFEFDYVGVIFGPDLVYRPMDGGWVGRLLDRLAREDAAPEAVVVPATDLTLAQIERLREALPVSTSFSLVG